MQKYKLLFLTPGLATGGAEHMLLKLLSNLDRDAFMPVVMSLSDKGTLGSAIEDIGVPVHCIGMKPSRPSLQGILKLRKLIYELSPDIIQGWMYHGNLAAWYANIMATHTVPVLWNIRGTHTDLDKVSFVSALVFRLCSWLSKTPVRIINNSHASARAHTERLSYPQEKWVVIPNGFDPVAFSPSAKSRKHMREELGLSEKDLVIGLIGRFHPMKDHRNFIHAAYIMRKRRPNVYFIMVGKDVNSENKELTTLVREFELDDKIIMLGERSDIPHLMASLDIATSSSAWGENFSNVLGEAMACGVPCVSTDVGDAAWIVGDTGKVVPVQNPEALATAWAELIELGVEGRRHLGAAARIRIIENFSLVAVVHQYEALYAEIMATHRA